MASKVDSVIRFQLENLELSSGNTVYIFAG